MGIYSTIIGPPPMPWQTAQPVAVPTARPAQPFNPPATPQVPTTPSNGQPRPLPLPLFAQLMAAQRGQAQVPMQGQAQGWVQGQVGTGVPAPIGLGGGLGGGLSGGLSGVSRIPNSSYPTFQFRRPTRPAGAAATTARIGTNAMSAPARPKSLGGQFHSRVFSGMRN